MGEEGDRDPQRRRRGRCDLLTQRFGVGDRVRVEDPGADDYLRTGTVVGTHEGKILVQIHGDKYPTVWEEDELEAAG